MMERRDTSDMVMGPKHGGDWTGYEIEYGNEPLDFSMNVNPLGVPEGVAKAIAVAAAKADRYPDPGCRRLRAALSKQEEVSDEWIFCGNGAADIIDRIALAFGGDGGRALVTMPTFSEYEEALMRCGWSVDRLELADTDFGITEKKAAWIGSWLEEDGRGSAIVFLCEPNNPTGITTDVKVLEKIADLCEESGTILVVDECFNGFLEEPEAHTMKGCLRDHKNLVILKAFTKIYGMAGVRLGYCLCSDSEKLRKIEEAGQPWNVSYLAEEAGLAALEEDEYLKKTWALISSERERLKGELAKLGIGKVYGEANYLFFRWPEDGGAGAATLGDGAATLGDDEGASKGKLPEALRRRGILIRDCSNFPGLGDGWYRIAVKKAEENDKLIEAFKEQLRRYG